MLKSGELEVVKIRVTMSGKDLSQVVTECHFWKCVGDQVEVYGVEHGRLVRWALFMNVVSVQEMERGREEIEPKEYVGLPRV